jgi:hypothetical protein
MFDDIVYKLLEESLQIPKYEAVTTKEYKRAYMEEKAVNRGWLMDIIPLKDPDAVGPTFKHLGMFRIYKHIDASSGEAKHIKQNWKQATLITGRVLKVTLNMDKKDIEKYQVVDSFEPHYIVNDMSELEDKLSDQYSGKKRLKYWLEATVESDDTQDAFGDFIDNL